MVVAVSETDVKSALLPGLDIGQYTLLPELPTGDLIGQVIGDLVPPDGLHLEAVRRSGRVVRTADDLVLEADDQLTIIGPVDGLPTSEELATVLIGPVRRP